MNELTTPPGAAAGDRVLTPLATASERKGLGDVAQRLTELRDWLADDLQVLERDLAGSVREQRTLSHKAAVHLIAQPGKRIRPLVTILSSRLAGRIPEEARHLAVACELVHAATLLHDDVLDMGTERRGAPTARMVYGNSASVLGGDHLLLEALRRVRRTGRLDLLDGVLEVIEQMVTAEALQLERRERFEPRRDLYMEVAEGKTAVLFSWGMASGARVGGLSDDQADVLWGIGRDLGLAFQAVDDCLDLQPNAAEIGKDVFADIREGKLTLPLIIACDKQPALIATLAEAAHDEALLASPERAEALLEQVRQTGCLDATRAEARAWSDRAVSALATLPDSEARAALDAIIRTAVERIH